MARTEFALAASCAREKFPILPAHEHLRRDLIESINEYRREQSEVLIGDFAPTLFSPRNQVFCALVPVRSAAKRAAWPSCATFCARVVSRAVSLAFASRCLPPWFLRPMSSINSCPENNLLDFALHCEDDAEIHRKFLAAPLSAALTEDLKAFLAEVNASAGCALLQPAGGFAIPAFHRRLQDLHAGQPGSRPRSSPSHRAERGHPSRLRFHLQPACEGLRARHALPPGRRKDGGDSPAGGGHGHGRRFYPDFSGVVRSRNYYPVPPMTFEDGIAAVALGLGRAVVDGGKCLRSARAILTTWCSSHRSKTYSPTRSPNSGPGVRWRRRRTSRTLARKAFRSRRRREADGTLQALASTYSRDNNAVYDGVSRPGSRIVTFAPMLKHGTFPLAEILDVLIRAGEDALGNPVEIEFAVRLTPSASPPAKMSLSLVSCKSAH
jgi:hypothetical protein